MDILQSMSSVIERAHVALGSKPDAKKAISSETAQWISLARDFKSGDLGGLEGFLARNSYLVGTNLSLADAAIYVALVTTDDIDFSGYSNVIRFLSHIQAKVRAVPGAKVLPTSTRPTLIPMAVASSSSSGAKKEVVPASDAKKDKKEKEGKAAPPAPPADGASEALNPSLLDIRAGTIVKCWNHPDSDKLLCEEVDCGEEGGPRNIASGIRAHYNADEFVGKKVMVLANLKDRAIAGFKSQGMVLCACNEDHSKVKILEPPANAKNGDRVVFSGVENGDPATPAQVNKKKILEKLAPLLKTDAKGMAFCGDAALTIGDKPVTSQLPSAAIS